MTPHASLHDTPPGARPPWRYNPFVALRHRNFRLFFFGQFISQTGSWMQRIAQAWLVLQLTNSPFLLGVVGALQWLPVLLFSLIGGVAADRLNKRALIIVMQTLQMLLAFVLGFLVLTGAVRYWHVAVLAFGLGLTAAFDIPTRQAFLAEMVEGTDMMNAVALNSTLVNGARLFGPAVAGIAIGTVGMAWAFLANGLSFIPVIGALLLMRVRPMDVTQAQAGLAAHLREGIAHLFHTPVALQVVTLVAVQSVFVMNFNILVPVFAKDVLHQGAAGFGLLMSIQGAGAVAGALCVASLSDLGPHPALLFGGAAMLGLADLLLAMTHSFPLAAAELALAGASFVLSIATSQTMLQVTAPDHLRGRVMSMYAIVMGGLNPAGALVSGAMAEFWGAPAAFAVAGTIGVLAAVGALRWRRVTDRAAAAEGPSPGQAGQPPAPSGITLTGGAAAVLGTDGEGAGADTSTR